MRILHKLNQLLGHLEEHLGVYLMLFTSFIVFIQVVFRYVFHYSLFWSEELTRYLLIWLIFIGSSIAVREKAHAAVDVLIVNLPPVLQRVMAVLASITAMIFCVILLVSSWKMIGQVLDKNVVTPSLRISMAIPYMAIPVGAVLMFIRFGQELWHELSRPRKGAEGVTTK